MSHPSEGIEYTVIIRLPFARGDFEDPTSVPWNTSQDQQLWKQLSQTSNCSDLNWEAMSKRFGVPLEFLGRQAAWLYERHFQGVKAQMRRLSVGESSRDPRIPSIAATAQRATAQASGEAASGPATPRSGREGISRTPSTNTVTQSKAVNSSPKAGSLRAFRGSGASQRRISFARNVESAGGDESISRRASGSASPENVPKSEHNQVSIPPSRSKRPMSAAISSDGDAEGDDESSSEEGYLPFATSSKAPQDDPSATLRGSAERNKVTTPEAGKSRPPPPDSSTSSASSAQPAQRPTAFSPRVRAELAKLSPRARKEGSEGSPSIGSSFSDLEDVSVTQSALEEALLSNMQNAGSLGMASRMSTLREALGRK